MILPQEWFNSQFTQILNCSVENPPYNENFKDVNFFFKKRQWIASLKAFIWEDVQDIIQYSDTSKTEFLVATETSTNVKVYKLDLTTLVATNILNVTKWKFVKFATVLTGWGWRIDTWTATSWTNTTLWDSTKSWVVNDYAWYYVYISDWTWAWQLRVINSNTDTTITVIGWDFNPDATSEYTIYKELIDAVMIATEAGIMWYDWTWFQLLNTAGWDNVDNYCFWKSRFWYLVNWQLRFSNVWDSFSFVDSAWANNLLNTWDKNAVKLYPFWDALVIWTSSKIYACKESIDAWTWTVIYSIQELISDLWLFSREAIIYDEWLYIVWSDKRFYSVWLEVIWTQYYATLKEQGSTIYNYLEALVFGTDELSIYADTNNIFIYTTNWNSKEFVFNTTYKGWLVNEYATNIKNKKILNNVFYYMGTSYLWIQSWYEDLWTDYLQRIDAISWQESIFQLKVWKYLNILLWKADYVQWWNCILTWHISNRKYTKTWNMQNAEYLNDLIDALWETMWENLTWSELFWGDNELYEQIADVEIIRIPFDTSWRIIEISLQSSSWNWFFFWWLQLYVNTLNSWLTYIGNVIWQ